MKNQPKLFTYLKVLVMMILLISSQLFAQENDSNKDFSDNIVSVTINVSTGSGENAEGSEITLSGYNLPYKIYTAILDTSETVTFDTVYIGLYNVEVDKVGYYVYSDDHNFISDTSLFITIYEKCYQPYNLYVDPLTSIATWHAARITQIREKFNDATFPPEGWQSSTASCGWFATTDGSSTNWTIPAWNSQYACVNDNDCGVGADGSVDYLITPKLDLRESPDFSLKFDSYFDGGNGQLAYVEYSLDAGVTWIELSQIPSFSSWERLEISLAAFSGLNGESEIWFAFHSNDNGNWASGWAIDNVEVSVGSDSDWPPQGYHVFLDDVFVAEVSGTTFDFQYLTWGQTYTVCVYTLCSCGLSEDECYTFTSAYLYPPINLHADTSNNGAGLIWYPPCAQGLLMTAGEPKNIASNSLNENNQKKQKNCDVTECVVPDNLLGFNVYRDEAFVDYVEYNGEDSITWGQPMQPGTYSFSVTAEYDVTVYGGTGTTESMPAGPVSIQVSYGFSLPFVEDWSDASFEDQQWETTSVNWIFDFSIGNPATSAEFHCYPMLTNYEAGLISYPILGSEFNDEDIFLEYDYMLDDRNETGLELMTVKIWENGNWHEVANYANEGDIDWTTENIDITEFAQGNDFKIGFFANGASSVNFKSWYIDNINVYFECPAPEDLFLEFEEYLTYAEVRLNWQLGEPPIEEWIQYDDGINDNAISAGGAFELSAYWPASTMAQYSGSELTEVEVYINDPTIIAIIKIYGAGTPTEPGDLLAEKCFYGTEESWITVELDSPVPITGEDIWIGYYGDAPAWAFFAGCDAGPAIAGFGDMVSMDGITFESLSLAYGLDYNWNIHGFVINANGEKTSLKPVKATPVYYTGGVPVVSGIKTSINVAPNKHRDFVSFSIYRNYNENGFELIEEGWTDYEYTDVVYAGGDYTYYVTAIYDQCISDPSNETGTVCYLGNEELNLVESIEVYPNPSINHVYINSKVDINKITVFDDLGKLVLENKIVENNNIKINTSSFDAGVYFIKIYTNESVVVRKVAITK
ncbi:MAG: T9SS type A sorting domain-containing protein [Bacteroidales bacterium]|nr:T9SS type A sorting domain-containing protein [Bacteroidales bacterium]